MNSQDYILVDLKGNEFSFEVCGKSADLSYYGLHAEKNGKFRKYRGKISINNLLDLTQDGRVLEYTEQAEVIRGFLLEEYKTIQQAQKWKNVSDEEIEHYYEVLDMHEPPPSSGVTMDAYQMRVVLFGYHAQKSFAIVEMGLGKSLIGSVFLQTLLNHRKVQAGRMLIIAPPQLHSTSNWPGEVHRFTNLRLMPIQCAEDFLYDADAYLIGSEMFRNLTKDDQEHYLEHNVIESRRIQAIVFDESSVLKSGDSLITNLYHEFVDRVKPTYQMLLTGLPSPNTIFQMWGQSHALGGWLGDSYKAFENRYGKEVSISKTSRKTKYIPRHGAYEKIMDRIQDICIVLNAEDHIELPPLLGPVIKQVKLEEDHMALYREIEKNYYAKLDERHSEQADGEEIIADTEPSLRMRLMQIVNGFVGAEDEDEKTQTLTLNWSPKVDAVERDLEEHLQDPSNYAIVWIRFRREFEAIFERLSKKWLCAYGVGGMSKGEREKQYNLFLNNPECRVMVAHPRSCKFGHTWNKANRTLWPSAPDDHEDYSQGRKRNHRRGQTRPVTEVRFYAENTLDADIWASMLEKIRLDRFIKGKKGKQ